MALGLAARGCAKLAAGLDHIALEVSDGFVVATGTSHEGAMSVKLPLDVEGDGFRDVMVPQTLARIVAELPAERVALRLDNGSVAVRAGYSTITLPVLAQEPFQLFSVEGEWRPVPLRRLRELNARVCPFVYQKDDRPQQQALSVTPEMWAASDGYRMSLLRLEGLVDEECLVPPALIKNACQAAHVQKIDQGMAEVCITDRVAAIRIGEATVITRLVDGEQVAWKRILLEIAPERWASFDGKTVQGAAKRMVLTAPQRFFVAFRPNRVILAAENAGGVSRESMVCLYDGPDAMYRFNVEYLASMADACGSIVRLAPTEPNKPMAIRGEGEAWQAALFPIRLVDEEQAEVNEWLAARSPAA